MIGRRQLLKLFGGAKLAKVSQSGEHYAAT
jgi:hypothetical protein